MICKLEVRKKLLLLVLGQTLTFCNNHLLDTTLLKMLTHRVIFCGLLESPDRKKTYYKAEAYMNATQRVIRSLFCVWNTEARSFPSSLTMLSSFGF